MPVRIHAREAKRVAALIFIISLLVAACGREEGPAQVDASANSNDAPVQSTESDAPAAGDVRADGTFHIVATTTQASDLSAILSAGVDGIEITPLMGAGVDPHLYQPTESDIRAMNRADMVIYSGLHLEGQFDAVFAALREQGTLVYALSQPVKDAGYVMGGLGTGQYQAGTDDPHFWFDPRNWELTVTDLAQTLAERFSGSVPTDAAALGPTVGSVIADLAREGAVELG